MNVLECYGVGTVTMDKPTDTDEVQIYVKGLFPDAAGEATTTAETKDVSSQDPTGNAQSSKTLQTNSIAAKWMPMNTNRVTAPDVRNGSKVVVYKFAGTNKFLWTYFGMDGTLRLETIVYAFSASPKVDENTPVTPANYYMFLISTRNKKIQLLTGMGNGEPTSYAIELDTGEGRFSIVDGESNILTLNSMAHALSFINDEKTFFNFEKKNITMSCEDTTLLKAKENILIQTKKLKLKAEESIDIETQSTTLLSPKIKMKGDVEHEGNYNQLGNYTVEGNTAIQGAFSQFGGAGNVTGGWKIDGVTYLYHGHTGVQSGGSKTGPIAV